MAPTGNDFIAPLVGQEISHRFDGGMGQSAQGISIEVAEVRVCDYELASVFGERVILI